MVSKIEPCGKRQKRKHEQTQQKDCPSSRPHIPKSGNQAYAREHPEQPPRVNHCWKGLGKHLWRGTKRNSAAILPPIVDRPKPEFSDDARTPEKETGDRQWNNRGKAKGQISQHDSFPPTFATEILG